MKSLWLIYFTVLFVLCLYPLSTSEGSETSLTFSRILPGDGLSEGVVHCVYRDSRGFIWFGTQGGLNRFDGHKIKIYKRGVPRESSLSNNQIISIIEDNDGILWIGSAAGLNKFDQRSETFTNYHNNSGDGIHENNSIDALIKLNDSLLLAGTFGRLFLFNKTTGNFSLVENADEKFPSAINNLLRLDERYVLVASGLGLFLYDIAKNSTEIKAGVYNFESLYGKNIWSVIKYGEDEIWAANAAGYFSIHIKKSSVNFVDISRSGMDEDFQVRTILKDSKGKIWFGTNSGLVKYDPEEKKFQLHRSNSFINTTLSSDRISAMIEDDSGLLWIATFGGGVNKLNLNQKKFYHFRGNQSKGSGSLEFNFILDIKGDAENNLFVSSLDKGFAVYFRSLEKFFHYTPFMEKFRTTAGNIYYFAFPYGRKKYFVFDYEKIYSYTLSESMEPTLNYSSPMPINFTAIMQDSEGYFWGCSYSHVYKFRESTLGNSISESEYITLGEQSNYAADDDTLVWVGATGLIRISKRTHSFRKITPSNYFPNKKMTDIIYFVHNDRKGSLWLGSHSDGLLKYNINKNKFEVYTIDNGLPDNTVYAILEDNKGNLWFSTNKGLSNFDLNKNRFTNYDQADGLLNLEFNRRACYKDKHGVMYFGGIEGIDYFNPDEININETVPEIVLTDFKLFNKSRMFDDEISFIKEVHLDYDQNFFAFEFASLDLTEPASNKFLYKLEGVDKNWVDAGNDRIANYTHISPGEYLFRVIGSNSDGIWNYAGVSVNIFITPPFWSTWWFRTSAVLLIILTGANFYFKKTKQFEKEKEAQEIFSRNLIQSVESDRKRIARELHDGLGQNLLIIKNKAHFNYIEPEYKKLLAESKSIEALALESINEIREIAYNLHPHQIDRLGITKAIESMIMKISPGTKIKFTYFLDNIDDIIPKEIAINFFRIVQEAVNNIINHSGALNASILIIRRDGIVELNIEDDGKGFNINEAVSKRSLGIASLFERAKILRGELNIESNNGSGTLVRLILKGKSD